MRRASLILAAVAAVAIVTGAFVLLRGFTANRAAIAAARADAARVREQRDSLVTVVRRRAAEQAALTVRLEQHRKEADGLRDSVTALERRRSAAQRAVRRLRTVGALQDRLRAAFPELGDSSWGLTTLPIADGDTLGIEVLMVPAWFAETFVIDHANAESWRAQQHRLLAVDSLHHVAAALQDSVRQLEAARATAYETGYVAAYGAYQDLSRRHVAELRKPRIKLGPALGILGAVGVGLLVGRAIP